MELGYFKSVLWWENKGFTHKQKQLMVQPLQTLMEFLRHFWKISQNLS